MNLTAKSHQIKINDFQLYAVISNTERDIIIYLHDSLGSVTLWRDFPRQLSAQAGCGYLMYDRRGYGSSDPFGSEPRLTDYMEREADVLIELMNILEIKQAILFGHSGGGTIALLAAAKYPERIKAVITEGAHVFVEEITLEGIAMAELQYENTHLKERLERYHGEKTQALFDAWTKTWLSPAFRNWNIEQFLPAIKCPVLVIQGTEDEYGSIDQVNAIVEKVSGNAEACIVPLAGHSPHRQNELWLIDICCSFLYRQSFVPTGDNAQR